MAYSEVFLFPRLPCHFSGAATDAMPQAEKVAASTTSWEKAASPEDLMDLNGILMGF